MYIEYTYTHCSSTMLWNTNFALFWMFSLHMLKHHIPLRSDPDVPAGSHYFRITGSQTLGFSVITPPSEMIDSALCKWILCGFCWLMGLEASQEWSTLIHWCLPQPRQATKAVALIYLICRHQYYKWTWSENQHSSSTGDPHGVRLPGACAHERTT